ncbi:HD domain-containing phosphohydrolase [Sulfuricurvum sp.]|nr:HD domain-containing phosphohydrolase [Sulfuricurvum sp.]
MVYQKHRLIESLALLEARTGINKDLALRSWIASKGGVYVVADHNNSQPNPYLTIPNRDLNTTNGLQLTLFNPAYALRQISELYTQNSGIQGHLTSLKLLNPNNQPKKWEKNALELIETTRKEHYEISKRNLYYMQPFFIDQQCMKCHANQGYKLGDIRGGLSVEIPLDRYEEIFASGIRPNVILVICIWIIGLIGLYWGYRNAHGRISEKIDLYEQNLYSLVSLIEQRDNYTAGHGRRVGEYSRLIAKEMGMSEEQQEEIYRAGALHDIGKVAIPDSILLKPGRLEPIEKKLIEEHVNASYELLSKVEIFASIAEIIRYHHERADGTGYPLGLIGDEIPIMSQILAIADCFDAMTTNRIYKARKTLEEAVHELNFSCKTQFRYDVLKAALTALASVSLEVHHSQRPTTAMEMERFSYFYKDQLTGVYTSTYLNFLFLEPDFSKYKQLWLINLGNISQFNKAYGWDKGDDLLKHYAQMLQEHYPHLPIIRFQGDDFILFRKDEQKPIIDNLYVDWLKEVGISVSISVVPLDDETTKSLDSLRAQLNKK